MSESYLVIEFMVLPYDDISRYVCIPSSWVQWRLPDHVVVAYPEEDPEATADRVRSNEPYSQTWKMYRARIVHSSETCEEAIEFVSNDNRQEQDDLSDVTSQLERSTINDQQETEASPSPRATGSGDGTPKRAIIHKYHGTPEHAADETWKLRNPEPRSGLVELIADSGVLIEDRVFQRIQRTSNSHNELARRLMEAVSSDEALNKCSVTGREATPLDYDGSDVRHGIHRRALSAILDFVMDFGQQRGWPETTREKIIRSLMNRLYEIRPKE